MNRTSLRSIPSNDALRGPRTVVLKKRLDRLFALWGHLAQRRPWPVVAVFAALTLGLASELPKLTFDASVVGYLHEDDPARRTYHSFVEEWERDDRVLVVVETDEVFDDASLHALARLHADLADLPGIAEVKSLVSAEEIVGVGDELVARKLLEPWNDHEEPLSAIRERALSNPLYRNSVISPDGRVAALALTLRRNTDTESEHETLASVHAVLKSHEAPSFRLHAAGIPVMQRRLLNAMVRDMGRLSAFAMVAIAFVLAAIFRCAVAVVVPLIVVTMSVLSTFGVMAWMGYPLSIATQILPSLLLAIGVADSIHILTAFYERHRQTSSKAGAIAEALRRSGVPIVLTTATTALGLVSFAAADMAPVADFGWFGPLGVLFALLYTLGLLPALLALAPLRSDRFPGRHGGVWLEKTAATATRRPGAVIGVATALVVLAFVGIQRLRIAHDALAWLPPSDELHETTDMIGKRLGGPVFLELLVDTGREAGLHEPDTLRRLERFIGLAAAIDVDGTRAGKSVSVIELLKEINRAVHADDPAAYAIPDERALVAQELLLLELGRGDDLHERVDSSLRTARVTLSFPYADAMVFSKLLARIESALRVTLGPDVHYVATGLLALIAKTTDAIIDSLLRSYVIALLAITPVMILLFGSLRLGLLSMIPNLVPIVLVAGLMGWADIPVGPFNLLIGSIAIGLAVDDTIHFTHGFQKHYRGDVGAAVSTTLRTSGAAILFSSVTLVVGFVVFGASSMANIAEFGLLTAATIAAALVADVVLMPAALAVALGHSREREKLAVGKRRAGRERAGAGVTSLDAA